MLLDIISPKNYNNYNIKIANIFGLNTAVYLSTVLSIYYKAYEKNKISDTGFFTLDRKYVCSVTTLQVDDQRECDKILKQYEILETEKTNGIKINMDKFISIFNESDGLDISQKLANASGIITKKKTKTEVIIENLKSSVVTDNQELRDAYDSWIDSVYAKQGWMSKKSVEIGQQIVDDFADHNLDVAINLINIAAVNGYRDMNWAISKYEEQYKKYRKRVSSSASPAQNVVLSEETF